MRQRQMRPALTKPDPGIHPTSHPVSRTRFFSDDDLSAGERFTRALQGAYRSSSKRSCTRRQRASSAVSASGPCAWISRMEPGPAASIISPHDRLGVDHGSLAADLDVSVKRGGSLHELGGGPRMQAPLVHTTSTVRVRVTFRPRARMRPQRYTSSPPPGHAPPPSAARPGHEWRQA